MSSSDNDEGPTSPDQPPSDPEPSDLSSDELLETDLTRAGIFVKEGSQVTSGGLDDSGDSSRQGVLGGPGPLVSSLPRALAATMQRPFVGELDISSPKSSSKKAPTVVSGKRGSRSSHLPRATPRKKMPQEKKSLGSSVSKIVLGRKSQACLSGGPVAPDTFPPISGLPGLGKAEKYSLVPVGTKQPRHRIGKTPAVSRTRDSELVAQGDCSRNKEPAPKGQLSASGPGPSRLSMPHGGYNSGDPSTKTCQIPGNSQLLAVAQRAAKSRGTPPLGDRRPLLHLPRQEMKQLLPGAQSCPQCPVLQREIDNLKDQLAAMQCLMDKFQTL
ncbi:uncharacterized protein CXorf49-like [Sus scrofa]|uniref:uncharacterized protein CXorf49-like n=1 Tax=Sus scrofa TaxID=9823 RepID=UPI0003AEF80E|nr:uncharacterized protein CXorf49-like [Sus scrofa]